MKRIVITLFLSISFACLGNDTRTSEAFIVTAYENYVAVVSPVTSKNDLAVILENKTLTNIRGKIVELNGKTLDYLTIPSGGFIVKEFPRQKLNGAYFVPLSPPGQEVEFILGKKYYEIPKKK